MFQNCPINDTSYILGYSLETPAIKYHWTFDELETYILSLYPDAPLELTGFNFAKLNRQRKIIKIDVGNPFSIESLKENVGQGIIILLPNRDIPERVAVRHMSEERNISEVPIEATQSTNITPVLQHRITDTRNTNTPTLHQDDYNTLGILDDNWEDVTSVDSVSLSMYRLIHFF